MNTATKKNIDILAPAAVTAGVGWYYFKKQCGKDWKTLLAIAALAFVAAYVICTRITRIMLDDSLRQMDADLQAKAMQQLGVTADEYARAGDIADAIYHAFHDSWWSEDEDKAIDAVNSTGNLPVLKVVISLYQKRYGLNLAQEFVRYTSTYNLTVSPLAPYVAQTFGL